MSTKLFVGNVDFNVTENDLHDAFAAHGTVESARVIADKFTGQSRGFGFVEMSTPEEAQALKFQLLTSMINDEILLQMASSASLGATDAEVETKFTDLKSQYTEEQFQDMLKQQKMTVDEVKGEMRKALTLEKLITKEITSRITVSDSEIRDIFEKNKASFNLPEG